MLKWIVKERRTNLKSDADVTITRCKDNRICLCFRNSSYVKLTTTSYIKVALDIFEDGEIVMYIAESDKYEGFKLTSFSQDRSKCHTQIKNENLDFKPGDYNFEFDKNAGFYYISEKHRL